jgi:hypothetical protein
MTSTLHIFFNIYFRSSINLNIYRCQLLKNINLQIHHHNFAISQLKYELYIEDNCIFYKKDV